MKRSFTKYPSNYVRANTEYSDPKELDAKRLVTGGTVDEDQVDLKPFARYLESIPMSKLFNSDYSHIDIWVPDMPIPSEIRVRVPDTMRKEIEDAVGIENCDTSEPYHFNIVYQPKYDQLDFFLDTEFLLSELPVSKKYRNLVKSMFAICFAANGYNV